MDEFLKTSKAKLNDDGGNGRVHVVIGNEACDLDSTVSAIMYAYFLYTKNKDEDTIIAPVINVAENQFRLRTETTHFFRKLNIQAKNLIFRDQVDFWRLQQDDRLELTLVDHNVLTGTDTQFEDCVVEVIDHHVQERPPDDRVKVKLDFVGSCSTLVAEELLDDTDCILDEVCAELLYGTILVDTINRSPDAGKITPRDEAVLKKLESIIPYVKGNTLFEELQAAKFDISESKSEMEKWLSEYIMNSEETHVQKSQKKDKKQTTKSNQELGETEWLKKRNSDRQPITQKSASTSKARSVPENTQESSPQSTSCNISTGSANKHGTPAKIKESVDTDEFPRQVTPIQKNKHEHPEEKHVTPMKKMKCEHTEEISYLKDELYRLKKRVRKLEDKDKKAEDKKDESSKEVLLKQVELERNSYTATKTLLGRLFTKQELLSHSVSGKAPNSKTPAKPKFDGQKYAIFTDIMREKFPSLETKDLTAKVQAVQKSIMRENSKNGKTDTDQSVKN